MMLNGVLGMMLSGWIRRFDYWMVLYIVLSLIVGSKQFYVLCLIFPHP